MTHNNCTCRLDEIEFKPIQTARETATIVISSVESSNFAGSIEADKCGAKTSQPASHFHTASGICAENDRVSPSEIEGGTHWKPNSGAVAFLAWGLHIPDSRWQRCHAIRYYKY